MAAKTKILRDLFNGPNLIYIVGAHDGLSAKLVEYKGFDGVWASSFEVSTSFAVPDANILTMSQYLERACEMNDVVSIPVVADCDTGYGNSNNVIHMVKKYESAGIAAVCIEDKKFPKVNSLLSESRQELAPIAEFVGKITAAKNAQSAKEFMVIARVEALIAGRGEKEALLRAEKYIQAGADAILIHSKSRDYGEIVSFAQKWEKRAPLIIVPTTYPAITAELSESDLLKLGIKMVIFANQALRASVKAAMEALAEIKVTGGTHTVEKKIAPTHELFKLQGLIDLREQEKKYLKSEHEDVVVIIPAAGKPANQPSMDPLLRDRAVCMVDINGRTLLERNTETLKKLGLKNINVIVGYKKEHVFNTITSDGINLIVNDEFENRHILHSIMLAQERMNERTLIVYSDILFDRGLVERILRLKEDIIIVGDNTYKKYGQRNKKLDLIKVREPFAASRREIITDELLTVERIGSNLAEEDAGFEFTGIIYFSRAGVVSLKELYHKNRTAPEGAERAFHEAASFHRASLTDIVQEAINSGVGVKLLPVNSGWLEIHGFEDYKFACQKIKE